jgi:predicted dithiol-disulfide oxidoreductase (DUF899 family)
MGSHMPNPNSRPIEHHPVVSHDEWLAARRALLEKEKAFTYGVRCGSWNEVI